jgi:hypothetical protein
LLNPAVEVVHRFGFVNLLQVVFVKFDGKQE